MTHVFQELLLLNFKPAPKASQPELASWYELELARTWMRLSRLTNICLFVFFSTENVQRVKRLCGIPLETSQGKTGRSPLSSPFFFSSSSPPPLLPPSPPPSPLPPPPSPPPPPPSSSPSPPLPPPPPPSPPTSSPFFSSFPSSSSASTSFSPHLLPLLRLLLPLPLLRLRLLPPSSSSASSSIFSSSSSTFSPSHALPSSLYSMLHYRSRSTSIAAKAIFLSKWSVTFYLDGVPFLVGYETDPFETVHNKVHRHPLVSVLASLGRDPDDLGRASKVHL